MDVFILLVVLGTSIWVLFDAKSMGVKKGQAKGMLDMDPVGWFLACLLLWIVVFPIYVVKRSDLKKAAKEEARPA
jgi:hypothetical protein